MKHDWQVCDITEWAATAGAPLPLKVSTNRFSPARWGPRERYWYACFPKHNTKGEWLFVITGDWHDPDGNQYLVQPPLSVGKAAPPAVLQKQVNQHITSQMLAFREEESQEALNRWLKEKATASTVTTNDYLKRKLVESIIEIDPALLVKDDVLLVPMMDDKGQEIGRQAIKPDGEKRFAYGQKTKGCFHTIVGDPSTVFVTEGYATSASIRLATGNTVYVCFSCGNLEAVTRIAKSQHPDSIVLVAADNDYKTLNNPGVTHANKAAQALQVGVVYPQGIEGTDWNDYHCAKGLDALREELLGVQAPEDDLRGYRIAHRHSDPEMTYKDIAEGIATDYSVLCNEENIYVYNKPVWRRLGPTEMRVLISEYSPKSIDNERRRKMVESEIRLVGGLNMRKHKEEGTAFTWNRLQPTEIAFQNGILDITNETLRPHDETDFIDSCLPWNFNPDAEFRYWDMALKEWFRHDSPEDQAQKSLALQCFFGYILLPHCKAKKSLICYGGPHTGKSRVMQAIKNMVGPKNACTVSVEELGNETALHALRGKMVNLINEPSEGALFQDGPFKKLVAGDPVSVRKLYENAELYQPNCKHAIFTNTIPGVRDTTTATTDRWLLLEFTRVFSAIEQDPDFDERALKEMEGVLAWAVMGAQVLWNNNWAFPECDASNRAVASKMQDQNNVTKLMVEWFKPDITGYTRVVDAWQLYRKVNGSKIPRHEFKQKLLHDGYKIEPLKTSGDIPMQPMEIIKGFTLNEQRNERQTYVTNQF